MIHRVVVKAVNGLLEYLMVERKRVPAVVLRDAERLESIVFDGYDCYFEGTNRPDCDWRVQVTANLTQRPVDVDPATRIQP